LLSDYKGMAKWFGAHYNQEVRMMDEDQLNHRGLHGRVHVYEMNGHDIDERIFFLLLF